MNAHLETGVTAIYNEQYDLGTHPQLQGAVSELAAGTAPGATILGHLETQPT